MLRESIPGQLVVRGPTGGTLNLLLICFVQPARIPKFGRNCARPIFNCCYHDGDDSAYAEEL